MVSRQYCDAVKAWLEERTDNVIINSNEPGGTEIGIELREVIIKERKEVYHSLAELYAFMSLRYPDVHNDHPQLRTGQHCADGSFRRFLLRNAVLRWGRF